MKKIMLFCIVTCFSTNVFSQQEIAPARPGIEYGAGVQDETSIDVKVLEHALGSDTVYVGRIVGKVIEVCQKKGCFMKLERGGKEESIMVRFKDYGFFMPQDIMGKTVVLEGIAKVTESSVEELKHFAEDAGKKPAEIAKITLPKRDIEITAVGVKVIR